MNKLFIVMLMLGVSLNAQQHVVKIDCKTDSLASIIVSKDKYIKELKLKKREVIKYKNEISDSLEIYKAFYDKAHKLLSPKIIARLEEN